MRKPLFFSTRPGLLATLFSLVLVAVVVVTVALWLSGPQCFSPVLLNRRDCLLLRSPLVWFTPDRFVMPPQPEVVAPLPVPPGEAADTIEHPSSSGQAEVVDVARENSGGYIALSGTWAERANDDNNLSFVPEGEPFIGAYEMGVYMPNPPVSIVTCLVDFVQRPCRARRAAYPNRRAEF